MLTLVNSITDFPRPVNGVIFLKENSTWLIGGTIDCLEYTIYCDKNVTITGFGQETSKLITRSTSGEFIVGYGTLTLHKITIVTTTSGVTNVFVDGSTQTDAFGYSASLDWSYVNFQGAGLAVKITNVRSFLIENGGFFCKSGAEFSGDITSAIFTDCSFSLTTTGGMGVNVGTANILSRLRLATSRMLVGAGCVGLDSSAANFMIEESLQLEDISFSGAGTYLLGLDHKSLYTRFNNCKGIMNSLIFAELSYGGTGLATPVPKATWTKAIILTTAHNETNKFEHDILGNKTTYKSDVDAFCKFTLSTTVSTVGNNRELDLAFFKNGSIINTSVQSHTLGRSNSPYNISINFSEYLSLNDYIEFYFRNNSAANAITVHRYTFRMEQYK